MKGIDAGHDSKLTRLMKLLTEDLKRKVLFFTYYKDTARYLYRHLGDPRQRNGGVPQKCGRREHPPHG